MAHRVTVSRLAGAALLAAASWLPLASHASLPLASDMGCYNCHGSYPRGDAPTFERLAQEYAPRKGDATAEQRALDKFRQGELLEHIPAHERVTPETAQQLIHWLFEGAK